MLTKEENAWNFKALRLLSRANWMPIEIDLESAQMRMVRNPWRIWLWRVSYALGLMHFVNMGARLAESLLSPEMYKHFKLEHFVVHFLYTAWMALNYSWAFIFFIKNPTECSLIFNHLFVSSQLDQEVKNQEDGQIVEVPETREENRVVVDIEPEIEGEPVKEESSTNGKNPGAFRRRPIFSYRLHEFLALCLPLFLGGTNCFTLTVLLIDPTRSQLIYFVVPDQYKNWLVYILLAIVESFFQFFVLAICYLSFFVQLQFLERCEMKYEQLDKKLRQLYGALSLVQPADLEMMMKEIRELILSIELFNRCFPFIIFSCKLYCLSVCIVFYFFTIRQMDDHPFLILFTCHLANVCFVLYCVIYAKAFPIPGNLDQLKKSLTMVSEGRFNHDVKKFVQRKMRGFRSVGIQVGSFNVMERTSTLDFLQFVVGNVVDLLVTFPK